MATPAFGDAQAQIAIASQRTTRPQSFLTISLSRVHIAPSSSERPRPAPPERGWVAPRDSRLPTRPVSAQPCPQPPFNPVVEYPSLNEIPATGSDLGRAGPAIPTAAHAPQGGGANGRWGGPPCTDFQITLRFDLLQKTDPSTWTRGGSQARWRYAGRPLANGGGDGRPSPRVPLMLGNGWMSIIQNILDLT